MRIIAENQQVEQLIASGYTTQPKADAAARAVGRVYVCRAEYLAVLRVDVRLGWWWLLTPQGEVVERGLSEMRNMRCICNVGARAEYTALPDHRGEYSTTDYVFRADYGELLGLLRGVARGRAA